MLTGPKKVFEPSAQASGGPRVLVALDYNSTIGPPQTKDRFLRRIGVEPLDFKPFSARFVSDHKVTRSQQPMFKRAIKVEALVRYLEQIGKPVSREQIADFARTEAPYKGVEETLRSVRDAMRSRNNIELVYAVVTNAWEDIINNMSLCQGDDPLVQLVYGQELRFGSQGELQGPANVTNHESKPAALLAARRAAGIHNSRLSIFVGNGYSDEPGWKFNRKNGGLNLGLHEADTSPANYWGFQDKQQMDRLLTESIRVPLRVEMPDAENNHGYPPVLSKVLLRDWEGLEIPQTLMELAADRATIANAPINLAAIRANDLGIALGEFSL